jgi:hypothetical protein
VGLSALDRRAREKRGSSFRLRKREVGTTFSVASPLFSCWPPDFY